MIFIQRFFLSIFLLVFAGTCLAVPAGINWQWANPKPQGNSYNAVAYNSAIGASVAIGDLGNVVASADGGVNWTVQNSNTTQNLNAIYTDATTSFIAVGDGGTIIAEGAAGSPPQLTGIWIDITDGSLTANLNGVAKRNVAGNDLFVAVGDNGTVLTNDGNSYVWTASSVPAGVGNLTAVVWDGSIFVAVSDSGKILASVDGVSWSAEFFTAPISGSTAPSGFKAVTWDSANNRFVAVGKSGIIVTSTDGTSWSQQTSGTTRNLFSVASSGLGYIATSTSGVIFTSSNGSSWVRASSGATGVSGAIDLLSINWDGSQFIIAGGGATLLTSPAGSTWTQRYPVTLKDQSLFNIFWSPTLSQYLVTGNSNTLLTSLDGANWTLVTGSPTPPVLEAIADNGAKLVGVDGLGKAYSSTDGRVWTLQTTGNTNFLQSIVWNGSQFVAVGSLGTILSSPDGAVWAARTSGVSTNLFGITWDGAQFIVVGSAGVILTSPDAINWVPQTSGTFFDFRAIAFNGSKLVSVGLGGGILISTDGVNWNAQTSGTTQALMDVSWTGTQFVAVGIQGTILTSFDGVNWSNQNTGVSTNAFSSVTGNKAQVIAVGSGGMILNGIASYSVGGNIAGLNGTIVLQNNGGDDLTVNGIGSFTFAEPLVQSATYDVSILTLPSNQTCNLVSGKGAMNGANVASVSINCTDNPVSTTSTTPVASGGGGGGTLNIYLLMLLPGLILLVRRR